MRIAYLVNQYPSVSHAFIRREVAALERAGVEVSRFTLRRSRAGIVGEEDAAEGKLTRTIVGASLSDLAKAAASSLLHAPLRSLRALNLALGLGLKSDVGLLRLLIYYVEALVLADWLRAERISHVHAHFGTNSATVAMLAATTNGGGFSMTVHGPEEFDRAPRIGLATKIRASRFSVAVSSFGASQLRRLVPPADWCRIKIVRCGIEVPFYEGAPSPPPAEPRLVFVGRLAPQKGLMTLLEAAAKLKKDGREFSVALIGDGEMRGELEAAAMRLDIRDRIEFLGWKAPGDVRRAVLDARALVLPSYAEGLPVTIMEAFALERPAIATYVAGIPELVLPGKNGWLVPAGDSEALAAAMRDVLDAPPSRLHEIGRAGRARVSAFHDIDEIAATLKALFAQALGERAS